MSDQVKVRNLQITEYIAEDYSDIHGEKVLLLDAGGKIPNLVIMKLSAYLRRNGNKVHVAYIPQKGHRYVIPYSMYDRVFISVIFKHDFDRTLDAIAQLNKAGIKYHIGGVAWDWRDNDFNEVPPDMKILPYDVEHIMPDYTAYTTCPKHANRYFARDWGPHGTCPVRGCTETVKNIEFGMGYTTRGCTRNCPFCNHPDTLVLMSDRTLKKIKDLKVGDRLIGFDEEPIGGLRRFRESIVTGIEWVHRDAYRITTESGASVISSDNHLWLTERGWKFTGTSDRITTDDVLKSYGDDCSYIKVGKSMVVYDDNITEIESLGEMDLVSIETSTHTYFANGFASHNCVVRPKEGYIHHHADIDEFLPEGVKKLVLLDNNFFLGPKWREHIRYIKDNDIRVNFNQGLDMRIMNDEIAEVLSSIKLANHTFRSNQVHFAFDHPSYEPMIRNGIELLMDHGFNVRRLMFYVLVGFWTSYEDDLKRIKILLEYDTDPYIMRYHKDDPILNGMCEWINGRHYSVDRSFVSFLKRFPRYVRATGKSLDELKLPEIAYEEIEIGKLYRRSR